MDATPTIEEQLKGLGNLLREASDMQNTPIAFFLLVGLDGTVMADSRVPEQDVVRALEEIVERYKED
jgi:hypothetical protein